MKFILSLLLLIPVIFGFSGEISLSGAGATFPEPLYSTYFHTYYNLNKVKVNYQGIGSGGGIKQLINKTVAFGGTDAPMNDQELKEAKSRIIHIPTCLGAVVVSYNIPGVKESIKLNSDVLTQIFMGKIKKWNDPALKSINPDVKFPDLVITVVHRSDGSGTTFVFTDYLSSVSKEWKSAYGANKAINWPVGVGGKGNPGVAQYIKMVPGSIGYIELAYARQANMPIGQIQNKSGYYIMPDLKNISAAANVPMPADTRVSIVNTSAKNGYPISSMTWIILYQDMSVSKSTENESKALVQLLWWMVHDAQKLNESKLYGKLPLQVVTLAEKSIKSVVFNGKPLWK